MTTAGVTINVEVWREAIPQELRERQQWVVWRYEQWEDDAKPRKMPYQRRGVWAATDDSATWTTFDNAVACWHQSAGHFDGVGFVLSADDPYLGVDLDDCLDAEGNAFPEALAIIDAINSYCEVSPSGKGVKCIVRAQKGPGKCSVEKDWGSGLGKLEMWNQGRYLALTGRLLPDVSPDIHDRQDVVDDVRRRYFPVETAPQRKLVQGHSHDDAHVLRRARAYLDTMDPAISGSGGHSQTFKAARAMVTGFGLSHDTAFGLLRESYNCRCQPPWSDRDLERKVQQAEDVPSKNPLGYIRDAVQANGKAAPVSVSATIPKPTLQAAGPDEAMVKMLGMTRVLADRIVAADVFAADAGGLLYRYNEGAYRPKGERFIEQRCKELLGQWGQSSEWTTHRVKEVVGYISVDAPRLWEQEQLPTDRLNVANGIVDVQTRTLLPHSPTFLSSVQLPVVFDAAATCPATERFVASVYPDDATEAPWELRAAAMLAPQDDHAVLLLGKGANGKSTELAAVISFIGKSNVSAVPLHRLETDRFSVARLVGKMANICPDLPAEHLAGTSVFKAITGRDRLLGENKFKGSFEFLAHCRLIFSANHPPRSADASSAFFRRWVVIPFERTFEGAACRDRTTLNAELSNPAELSGVLNKALAAWGRLRRHGFTISASMARAADDFRQTTDPVAVWLERNLMVLSGAELSKESVRNAYKAHASKVNAPPASDMNLSGAIKKMYPTVREGQRVVGGREGVRCWLGLTLAAPQE